MQIIDTHLTEAAFLERLSHYCHREARGNRGYSDQETFIFSQKERSFWIGKHMAYKGKSGGYATERINGTYQVKDNGLVTVSYRLGKHPALIIPHAVILLLGLLPLAWFIKDILRPGHSAWIGGALIGLVFVGFGLSGFFSATKTKAALEEHLLYICDALREGAQEGEPVEVDTFDVSDISDGDVYPIRVIYGDKTYLSLHYYTADGNGDGILNDGENVIYFKDEAQMQRFCLANRLTAISDGTTYRFDDPVTNARDHGRILNRWNLLNTISGEIGVPFAGNEEAHDGLYELLFSMSLPADESVPLTDFDEDQAAELKAVFEGQDTLLSRFRLYRE